MLQPELPHNSNKLLLKLKGIFVDIMCNVNPEFQNTGIKENGTKTLYIQVIQSIYSCIHAALLWYKLYVNVLMRMGFILNDYDLFVANNIINGKQCTIVWHIDDNKISHEDPNVVSEIIIQLKGHLGKFTVTRGKKHKYLGMKIRFTEDVKVVINMSKKIQKIYETF